MPTTPAARRPGRVHVGGLGQRCPWQVPLRGASNSGGPTTRGVWPLPAFLATAMGRRSQARWSKPCSTTMANLAAADRANPVVWRAAPRRTQTQPCTNTKLVHCPTNTCRRVSAHHEHVWRAVHWDTHANHTAAGKLLGGVAALRVGPSKDTLFAPPTHTSLPHVPAATGVKPCIQPVSRMAHAPPTPDFDTATDGRRIGWESSPDRFPWHTHRYGKCACGAPFSFFLVRLFCFVAVGLRVCVMPGAQFHPTPPPPCKGSPSLSSQARCDTTWHRMTPWRKTRSAKVGTTLPHGQSVQKEHAPACAQASRGTQERARPCSVEAYFTCSTFGRDQLFMLPRFDRPRKRVGVPTWCPYLSVQAVRTLGNIVM